MAVATPIRAYRSVVFGRLQKTGERLAREESVAGDREDIRRNQAPAVRSAQLDWPPLVQQFRFRIWEMAFNVYNTGLDSCGCCRLYAVSIESLHEIHGSAFLSSSALLRILIKNCSNSPGSDLGLKVDSSFPSLSSSTTDAVPPTRA